MKVNCLINSSIDKTVINSKDQSENEEKHQRI